VVFGERAAQGRLVEVARDEPLAVAVSIGERLRMDEDGCLGAPVLHDDDAERLEARRRAARQRGIHRGRVLRAAEHEQPAEDGERVVARAQCPLGR
jgi:hypothetical protein